MKPFWKRTSYILLIANIVFMLIIPMTLDLLMNIEGMADRISDTTDMITVYSPTINACLILLLIISYMTWQAEDSSV